MKTLPCAVTYSSNTDGWLDYNLRGWGVRNRQQNLPAPDPVFLTASTHPLLPCCFPRQPQYHSGFPEKKGAPKQIIKYMYIHTSIFFSMRLFLLKYCSLRKRGKLSIPQISEHVEVSVLFPGSLY